MQERRRPLPERKKRDGRARAFWSGTISFGLVSIPVDLFPANRKERVSLRMLAPDGTPLSRRYYCPEDGREVPYSQIVRGYEVDGEWIVLSDEELEAAEPKRTREIDLRLFVERDELDPVFFERAYYLAPADESTKAYRLLAETMERTGRAGIATFVMRTKEYLVAILADNGILRAETMRFADEIRSADDVDLPEPRKPKAADVKRMRAQISKLEKKDMARSELEDRNAERLLRLIERKRKARKDVVESDVAEAEQDEDRDVIDLMDVLKQRLAATESTRSDRSGNGRPSSGAGSRTAKPRGRKKRATRNGDRLAGLSKKELYERAKAEDIEGRSGMTKDELVRALSA
jgi:DNA end-binding protein Ku